MTKLEAVLTMESQSDRRGGNSDQTPSSLIQHLWFLFGNKEHSLKDWLDLFEKGLIESKIISSRIKSKKDSNLSATLVALLVLFTSIRHFSCILSFFSEEFSQQTGRIFSLDVYHCLSMVSPVYNGSFFICCLVCSIDRLYLLYAEKHELLYCLYEFYPSEVVSNNLEVSDQEMYESTRRLFRILVGIQRLSSSLFTYPGVVMCAALCVVSIIQQNSLHFTLVAIPLEIIDCYLVYFIISYYFSIQFLLYLSVHSIALEISKVKEQLTRIQTGIARSQLDSDDILFTREIPVKIEAIRTKLRKHNIVTSQLLSNAVLLMCPSLSAQIMLVISDVPLWVAIYMGCLSSLLQLFYFSCIHLCGGLYPKSRSLLGPLYSILQQDISCLDYKTRRQMNTAIKALSGNREPLSFTLRDGDPLTTSSSGSFTTSTVLLTLMFLNNRLLRDVRSKF